MGSHVTRVVGFLPANRYLHTPFILDFVSGTGQSDGLRDRLTDNGHQSILPPPYGGGA